MTGIELLDDDAKLVANLVAGNCTGLLEQPFAQDVASDAGSG